MSFAKRLWVDFEALASELTRDSFGTAPTQILRTRQSKDGGFDAVVVHDLGRVGEALISFETLMEAKLRSSKDSVGLRAFAATMIVAFNGTANCVVIVTNRDFSPQALQAARDFQWKSRLQVILANGATVSAWIRPRLVELAKRYPSELLKELLLANEADEACSEVEIPASGTFGSEPAARIRFGLLENGVLSPGRLQFVRPQATAQLPPLAGRERNSVLDALSAALSNEPGCAVLIGPSGSGKSHALRLLAGRLASVSYTAFIDLSQVGTVRGLFARVASAVIGVEISAFLGSLDRQVALELFGRSGRSGVPEQVVDAVVEVMTASTSSTGRDIDHLLLLEYLASVLGRSGRQGGLLVFQNIDNAPNDVVEFLHGVVGALVTGSSSVVLELVSPLDRRGNDAIGWNAHVRLFERSAGLGRFVLPPLSRDDAADLLLFDLPGLGVERAYAIAERVGHRPLFLHHASLWLKRRKVVEERAPGQHLVEDPSTFFEGIRPEACEALLDRHVDIWRRETGLPYADVISAAALLAGALTPEVLSIVVEGRIDADDIADALVATGLFVVDSTNLSLRPAHSLLLERMVAIENGVVPGIGARPFARLRIARRLLENAERCWQTPIDSLWARGQLFHVLGNWEAAWEACHAAGASYESQRQQAAAARAYTLALESAQRLTSGGAAGSARYAFASLLAYLRVEDARYRLGLEENRSALRSLERTLALGHPASGEDIAPDDRLQGEYLLWRAEFTAERFTNALSIAQTMCTKVRTDPVRENKAAGLAFVALGITLKATERLNDSVRIFEEAREFFPASDVVRRSQVSNLAAIALRSSPSKALELYQATSQESDLGVLELLHLGGDIAMAQFLDGHRQNAKEAASRAVCLADANGVPAQAARGRNILACVYWAEQDFVTAIALFDRAVLDAERSFMERFLWRFRTNLAAAAIAGGDVTRALANARSAEQRIVEPRLPMWLRDGVAASYRRSRWYVALLSIGLTYRRSGAVDDLGRMHGHLSPLVHFWEDLDALESGHIPQPVFEGTTHLQASQIMITG